MNEWITKAEALELGLTEGQFKWRVLTGDIKRHQESRRLYRRYDVERLVKCGRSAQKPFGSRPAREDMPKRQTKLKKNANAQRQFDEVTRMRAQLALRFCAHAMTKDNELGALARRLFRSGPEKLLEAATDFA